MKRKSFTLVEVLVSITIFTIVIGVVLDLSVFALKIQQRNLADQYLLNQVNYTIEYISRQLRMAQRDDGGSCVGTSGVTYYYNSGTNALYFLDYKGNCQRVELSNNSQIEISGVPITSEKFEISDFKAYVVDNTNVQPRVTFSFKIRRKGSNDTPFQFQTTVSQRNLNL